MKNIAESSEVFMAYANIDAGYYLLKQIHSQLSEPQDPVIKMIDEQTGYGKQRIVEQRKEIATILKGIIKNKKFIEADYKNDELMLSELLKLK